MAEEDFRVWESLCELIWGCAIGQAIHVAVELGVPELLASGPKSADQLASATVSDLWTLETVLRSLAAFDVLSIDGEGRYALAQMGRLLLKSSRGPSAGEAGEFFDTIYSPLGALLHMARTGRVAFDHVFGESFYDHLEANARLATHFYDSMAENAPQRYAGLGSVIDFLDVARVVDVGGGDGSLLIQILREHPDMTGVILDLPVVSGRAMARIEAAGFSGRCKFVSGDFLDSVPSGGDVYVLAQILNNWRDAEARHILTNCRAAIGDRARLLVLEPVYISGAASRWHALVSLGVMAQRGGRTRSEAQLEALFAATGFRTKSVRQLPSSATFAVEAEPIA